MYLLYLDESGSAGNTGEQHLILAGVAVPAQQIYHLIHSAEQFVASLNLGDPNEIELHASRIISGAGSPWRRRTTKDERPKIIGDGLRLLAAAHHDVKLFATVVDKNVCELEDPIEYAFKKTCHHFDSFLTHANNPDLNMHGLIVMDKSRKEKTLQELFREHSNDWGPLQNLTEVPLFVDSEATRLIQLTDLLAWAVWRNYERGDSRYFNLIADRFDEGGLVHHKLVTTECGCPACVDNE